MMIYALEGRIWTTGDLRLNVTHVVFFSKVQRHGTNDSVLCHQQVFDCITIYNCIVLFVLLLITSIRGLSGN